MKCVKLACITALLLILSSASEWEGAAAVAPGGQFPESGFYVATNSFPRNTVVDVTNLENGKSIRVIVAGGLETPGLLGVLSGNAAGLVGLRSGAIGRIRMTQPSDTIAFSRFTEGMAAYRESEYTTDISMTADSAYKPPLPPEPAPFIGSNGPLESTRSTPGSSMPDNASLLSYVMEPEWAEFPYGKVVDVPETAGSAASEDSLRVSSETVSNTEESLRISSGTEKHDFILVPAEERLPEYSYSGLIAPENIIPGIPPAHEDSSIPKTAAINSSTSSRDVPFSIPVISRMEQGKYYVQVGAFSKLDLIESAVNRIGANYPLALLSSGGAEPVYRILLGPLNLGESGAMLQRLKSIGYADAFIRSQN